MADMDQKRSSFKTVSHNHFLATSVNKSLFFGSKIGQMKHKPLRMRNFFRFTARNCGLHLQYIFFKIITRNKKLRFSSNIKKKKKVSKSHKQTVVSKNFFMLLETGFCGWCFKKRRWKMVSTLKKGSITRRKLFETFLEIIHWETF